MSSSSSSDEDNSIDVGELLEIETRCRERLELHVKSLSEARVQDKKHIQKLVGELKNCSQEIGQLSARNEDINCLNDHVHNLEIKLAGNREQRRRAAKVTLWMEKLEESVSSMALESQCEIESMKLNTMALEQTCLEATKTEEENVQERSEMNVLVEKLEV
ncbi:uncharacterized protein LOC111284033 isoform X2 [Durio zibethinus]|uniref:Uncharacterized protein LOC111284033 isoform X2 n=1 Tax=Durio zibethinus TaxID=66656 RepID=A0A6P5XK64_DURZI|nr:uncharacterized protein LOC111284033 isoform X2 [Durio zibethinus]